MQLMALDPVILLIYGLTSDFEKELEVWWLILEDIYTPC